MLAKTSFNRFFLLFKSPRQLWAAMLTGLIFSVLFTLPALAQGPTCTVSNNADSGANTLRQCLTDVDAGGTIDFNLTTPVTITLTSDELTIEKSLTISGTGVSDLAISGDDAYRVFYIDTTDPVTITDLTIRDGYVDDDGGGIYNYYGDLTLTDAAVIENTADDEDGGGIYNYYGDLTLANVLISNNYADDDGDGLCNYHGTITATDVTISDNLGDGFLNDEDGEATLTNVTINGNDDEGINNEDSAVLHATNVTINDNYGDGIFNDSDSIIILTNVIISRNGSEGIYNYDNAVLDAANVVISGNDSGGIDNEDSAIFTATNVTISGNDDEGIYNHGDAYAYLNHVTIKGNDKGIYNSSGYDVEIQNCIIAGNDTDIDGSNIEDYLISRGYNIIGSVAEENFQYNATGDLYGDPNGTTTPNAGATESPTIVDARLAPLADNGGNTQTHALQPASPAINRVPGGTNGCGSTFTSDQRGISRPQLGACDAGAYETDIPLSIAMSVDDNKPDIGQILNYNVIISSIDVNAHTGVVISNTLPGGLTLVGDVTVTGGSGGTTGAPPTLVSGLTLASGETVTITYEAQVDYDTNLAAVRLTNTAEVSSTQETNPVSDSVTVQVNPVDSDGDGIADPYDSEPYNPNVPSSYPARVHITTEDNEDNQGSGSPDNDVSEKVYKGDPRAPIEFNIWIDEALPRQNALLAVLADDIDWPSEFNEVYLNGYKLEETIGENNLINSTTFVIPDVSWVEWGNNLVQVQIDVHDNGYGPIIYNGQIVTDFGSSSIGQASIRSLDVSAATVGYDETVTVTMEVDTTGISQTVRLELVLRDADGTAIAFDSSSEAREWTVYGNSDEPHEWVVELPSSGADGMWTLTAAIYDINSDKFSDYKAKALAVPDTGSVTPDVIGISPNQGYIEAAVVITGTNFVPDDTACTVGGIALENQIVLNGNTITGNISDTLTIGSHDVTCTTSYGSDTLTNSFTLLNTPPIAVIDNGSTAEVVPLALSVLENDYDANNDTLSVDAVGTPNYGSASISGSTHIIYTPTNRNADYTAIFTYTASDGSNTGNPATVVISVTNSPELVATHPTANAVAVPLDSSVVLTYSAEISAATVTSRTVAIHSMMQGLVTGTHTAVGNVVTVAPNRNFFPGELVYAIGTSDINSQPAQWQFTAGAITNRCVAGFNLVSTAVLTSVRQDSVATWGDYDNDGDLDILLTGNDGSSPVASVYQNTGSGFSEVYASDLHAVNSGSADWGDYDNDGDLDILLTGSDGSPVAGVFQNTGSGFSEVYAGSLTGVMNSSAAWGDYDNDGDLDIILSGYDGTGSNTQIYRNTGSGFSIDSVASANLSDVEYSSVDWGDYDNDGDLDILLTGIINSWPVVSQIYQNTNGIFNQVYTDSLAAAMNSDAAWGDYDNDGDLDILLAGGDSPWSFSSKIYQNTGSGFSEVYTGSLTDTTYSSVDWGDYDNDGDLDILLTGNDDSWNPVSKVYQNTGSGFDEVHAGNLTGVSHGSAAWGDYDNDGDLDILLSGEGAGATLVTELWRNNDCPPDVTISKTVTPTTAKPGDAITYTLIFSNVVSNVSGFAAWDTGKKVGPASGVVITDIIPPSITNISVLSSGVTITDTGTIPAYVWNVADLAPGEGGIITLTGILTEPLAVGYIITNTTVITCAEADSNNTNNSDDAPMTVQNAAPTAAAGDAQSALIETTATLNGSGSSDPNGDALTYGWAQTGGTPVTLSDTSAISPTFTAPNAETVLTFTLTVTDTGGLVDTDNVVITVHEELNVFLPLVFKNYQPLPDLVISDLVVEGDSITVTVRNIGDATVVDAFWVDVFFDPTHAPLINERWYDIAAAGVAWGVTQELAPDESLTLTVGGDYYFPDLSSDTFSAGATVYGFVDILNFDTTYGNVAESNEANNLWPRNEATTVRVSGNDASSINLPQRGDAEPDNVEPVSVEPINTEPSNTAEPTPVPLP